MRGGEITGTGEGGISLTGGDRKTLTPGRNFVENCRIHDYSRWARTYRPGVGVDGVGNRVAHCLIYDAPHNAILLGGNDHVIEYNEIHHVCRRDRRLGRVLHGPRLDHARQRRPLQLLPRPRHRRRACTGEFHDVMAIYLDDTAAGTTVFGNVCVRAGHAVMIGGGRDTVVANNVFVDCRPAVSLDARGLGWAAKYLVPGGGWDMQSQPGRRPLRPAPVQHPLPAPGGHPVGQPRRAQVRP